MSSPLFFTLHPSFFTLRSSPFILHSSFFTLLLHSSFFTLRSSLFTLHSSLFTLRSSLFVLHSSFFTLHSSLNPPLSRLSNCPALPCSPKSFISNRWRVFEMSELEKPVRLTISPGLKASNTRMQMRYSLLLNVYSPMSLSHKNLFVYRNSSSISFLSYLFLSFPPINLFCSRSKFSKK